MRVDEHRFLNGTGVGVVHHAMFIPAGAAAGLLVGVAEGALAASGEVATTSGDAVGFVVNTGALASIVGAVVGLICAAVSLFAPDGARLSVLRRRLRDTDPTRVSAGVFAVASGVGVLLIATYVVSKSIIDLSRHQAVLALAAAGAFLVWFASAGVSALMGVFARLRLPRPWVALTTVVSPALVFVAFILRTERDRVEAMPLGAYTEAALILILPVVIVAACRWRPVAWSMTAIAALAGGAVVHLSVAFTPTEALHLDFHGKLSREVLKRVAFFRPSESVDEPRAVGAEAPTARGSLRGSAARRGNARLAMSRGADSVRLSGGAVVDGARATGRPPMSVPSAPLKIPEGQSVVLITVDTLRADRLGCYGYGRPTSPQLDRLAASGVRFERAYSTASLTSHAIPPMLTSRYISEMSRTFAHFIKFTPDNVGFPTLLQKAGVRTVGLASHWYIGKPFGFANGFDVWDTSPIPARPYEVDEMSTSEPLTKAAQKQLAAIEPGKRFLLWVHYLDPHKSFLEHPGFPSFGKTDSDRYDGEIAYMDHFIGQLLDTLAKRADAGKITVIFLSDHGEGLGNHNHMHHGWNAFEELIRIPFIIMAPGAKPRVLPGPVSILDIAPTILDIFGVAVPKGSRGRSLAPILWGGAKTPFDRPIIVDMPKGPTNPLIRALIQSDEKGDWKLIYWAERKVYQLFNLRDDPKELQNLTRKEKDRFLMLKAELDRWFTKEIQIKRPRGVEDEDEAEP